MTNTLDLTLKNILDNSSLEKTNSKNHESSFDYLKQLLFDLEDVEQSQKYHPEGNALFHSLQVFELALQCSNEPRLWAAALFHDVGKSVDSHQHCKIGKQMLSGVLGEDIVWLVEHHLDLMTSPKKTHQKYSNHLKLNDLEILRKCDVKGRDPFAKPMSVNSAVNLLVLHGNKILAH